MFNKKFTYYFVEDANSWMRGTHEFHENLATMNSNDSTVFFNRRHTLILEGQDFCSCRTFHKGLCLYHPILQDTLASKKTFTDHSDTLFSLVLSDEGFEEFDIR